MRESWWGLWITILVLIFFLTIWPGAWMVGRWGMPMMRDHPPMQGMMMRQAPRESQTELADDGGTVDREITVAARDFSFDPTRVHVRAGQKIRLTLVNEGRMFHDITVDSLLLRDAQGRERTGLYLPAQSGQDSSVTWVPLVEGEFTFYCAVPGHRQAGMAGFLAVDRAT